jgi:hypothetical protein
MFEKKDYWILSALAALLILTLIFSAIIAY